MADVVATDNKAIKECDEALREEHSGSSQLLSINFTEANTYAEENCFVNVSFQKSTYFYQA